MIPEISRRSSGLGLELDLKAKAEISIAWDKNGANRALAYAFHCLFTLTVLGATISLVQDGWGSGGLLALVQHSRGVP